MAEVVSFQNAKDRAFREDVKERVRRSGIFDVDAMELRIKRICTIRDERNISYEEAEKIVSEGEA